MNVLRAANETDTRHAEPVCIERFLGGGDQRRMIGQTEIIVCAHVEHPVAIGHPDVRVLWRRDDPLGFV